MRAAAVWGMALLVAGAAGAQVEHRPPPEVCRLPVLAASAPASVRVGRPEAIACDLAAQGARFEVEYTGFPPGAEEAFQAAVDTWACRIRSTEVIRVAARWAPLDGGTLGSAGPFLVRNFEAAPSRDVWYPAALADALSGRDLGDGGSDVEAVFNSAFGAWHMGPGPAPAGLYDLYTVVLHELGHGLGLIGALTLDGALGRVGREPEGPYAYDLHTRDEDGMALLDGDRYPDGSVALAEALRQPVAFAGRAVAQAVAPSVPLYSPPQWVAGGSYSHLDEDAFEMGTPDGLMTPFIARGETVAEPGTAVCAMLADVGWELAGDCAARVGPLAAPDRRITAERRGANPFAVRTTVRLHSAGAVVVRARLLDVLGRRVADYGTFVIPAGGAADVRVDARELASGMYVLSVTGGPAPLAVPLAVAR